MLERDEDGDHGLLVFRPVNIHAVLVVQGEQLLRDDGDDLPVLIVKLEIQPQDIPLQLPAQPLDVGDVPDDMKQLVGELKGRPVLHGDEMPLMEGEELFLHVRHMTARSVIDLRFVMERGEFGLRAVEDPFVLVRDLDPVVQRHHLRTGEQRARRGAEALHVIDVRLFSGLPKAMYL